MFFQEYLILSSNILQQCPILSSKVLQEYLTLSSKILQEYTILSSNVLQEYPILPSNVLSRRSSGGVWNDSSSRVSGGGDDGDGGGDANGCGDGSGDNGGDVNGSIDGDGDGSGDSGSKGGCNNGNCNAITPQDADRFQQVFFAATGGVDGTVASESVMRFAGTILSRVRARPPVPGLTESLKAWGHLVVDWLYTKTQILRSRHGRWWYSGPRVLPERSAGTLLSRVRAPPPAPGLTQGLKA
ncbi:hypothetical protein PoB_004450000 [Plakobranchus ocellatus]|uniref:Uncharacterized protein n=1 Tax=Plakobranchus ocellatus TaxID=259542 RepID=A0AAV4BBJ3_9GAST|nr:hypothetical protein PoB_004450000 [Plakobranchus ocellatus]